MTDEDTPRDSLAGAESGVDLRDFLKGALGNEGATPSVDVLAGVQRKLRDRSGGKFYRDVWSTAKEPPVLTYFATSVLMLVAVLLVYAVLAPLRGQPEKVRSEPAPVEVLAPPR